MKLLTPFLLGVSAAILVQLLSAWWLCVAAFIRTLILPLLEVLL